MIACSTTCWVPARLSSIYESRDDGRHFKPGKRPGKGAFVDLTVRSDGVIVAAIEKEQVTDEQGKKGVHAQIFTSKNAGVWTAGPIAETFYGSAITHHGDSVVVPSPSKKKPPSEEPDTLGLDAKGHWTLTSFPDPWLSFTWTDLRVEINAPIERPGFPKAEKNRLSSLAGLMGGLGISCQGVECLGFRDALGPSPSAGAFHDGVCAKEGVKAHTELIRSFTSRENKWHEETHTTYDCDDDAPAERASTLLVRDGEERRMARLPLSWASGVILGSDRASFVYCNDEHRGRPSLLHVSPRGALTEVASGIPGDLDLFGAESASDGTTVLWFDEAAWICAASVLGVPRSRCRSSSATTCSKSRSPRTATCDSGPATCSRRWGRPRRSRASTPRARRQSRRSSSAPTGTSSPIQQRRRPGYARSPPPARGSEQALTEA